MNRRTRSALRCAVVAAVLTGLAGPGPAAYAQDRAAVSVPCVPDRAARLNEAVRTANAQPAVSWTVTLQAGCAYTLTRPFGGVNGLEPVTGHLRITSDGPDRAVIARSHDAGTPDFRVMEVETGGRLVLDRITLGNGSVGSGAGIFNNFGTLTLNHSALTGNRAKEFGGGLFNNGERAVTTLNHSTVGDGSSLFGGGGAFNNGGRLHLTDSAVTGNHAVEGVGGGILNNGGLSRLRLNRTTVSANEAGQTAGGLLNSGSLTTYRSPITHNLPNNCTGSTTPVPGCAD
ncbi:hypothetical protein [Streptomyces sp. BE147]|uniref:hypothetical protein n=1 Tax=unclassified Streptomyces TaxID=2593676 RepID=UPI002E75E209|nr:hypothetical protein [Streptomyces sp. BE147]MEE1738703.1 hypothetical protein [Streptomyces sp. BE147]